MTVTRRSMPSGRLSAGLPSATRPSAGRALSLILACASAGRGPAAGFLEAAALLARSFSRRPATAATALSEAGDFTGLPEWAAGRFLCAVWGLCLRVMCRGALRRIHPMCCPGRVGSRGAKAKRVILFDNGEITKWKLASAHIAVAHFFYKLLKFFKFVLRQAARAALGLESLQAPSGRQIGELHQRATQLARRRGGIRNDLLALEEFLQRLRALSAAPALDHLGGDLRRLLAQIVEQLAQQADARLLARIQSGALREAHFTRDGRVVQQPHDGLSHETAASGSGRPARARAPPRRGRRRSGGRRLARRGPQLLEALRGQAHDSGEPLEQQLAVDTLRHPREQWPRTLREARASVGVCQLALLRQLPHQVLRQRHGALHTLLERRAALRAHQRVRILTLRQEQEADLASFACLGQRLLQRAPRRGTPGAIAVEGEHHRGHEPKDAPQMLGRGRGAERRQSVV